MKLDVTIFRYMSRDDFRVLTAIEMGSKNHYLVPVQLIEAISALKRGGCRKVLNTLLKNKLIAHDSKKYDGYKLTYNGYDFLALKALVQRGHIGDVGIRIGVGKEADIHVAYSPEGKKLALKLHRLGRVSFRSIKNNRDYLQHRKHASWMYMARLAATKEYAYNKALSDAGFRVPEAIDHNRHCILMEFVDALPLFQVRHLRHPMQVMERLFRLIVRLGKAGLIHGDFNEFNLLINEKEEITLIDFPQIVMMTHLNGDYYFGRDVDCIKAFFRKRFAIECEDWPRYEEVMAEVAAIAERDAPAKAASDAGSDCEEAAPVKNVGMLMERRDDDLLLGAILEERELEEEAEHEDASEAGADSDEGEESDEEEPEAAAKSVDAMHGQFGNMSLADAEAQDGSDDELDMDAIINRAMQRRRMFEEGQEMPSSDEEEESGEEESASDEEAEEAKDEKKSVRFVKSRCDSPLRIIRENVARQMFETPDTNADGEGGDDGESSSDDERDTVAAKKNCDDLENVPTIENQIHVLKRKKREKLTPAEVREKMKNKAKQVKIKTAGKNKGKARKANQEFKDSCKDFGI